MTGLRTDEGIDSRELSARFGARKLQYFVAQAEKFVAQGNIVQRKSVYYIPAERYLISDSIISSTWNDAGRSPVPATLCTRYITKKY